MPLTWFQRLLARGGNLRRLLVLLPVVALSIGFLIGCGWERRKTDEELGLSVQQARGRRVFDRHCNQCHDPYGTWSWRGPSMVGLFKKPYLPSGTPANNERVLEVIVRGKAKMPSFRGVLTENELEDLFAYLHTL